MNPVALRLLNQQLVAPQFREPEEVVRYMGAMQAQEYRMMRWAVAMRTCKPSAKKFKEAYDSGRIIRMHLMRGTWQLVAAEDYWAWLTLCAPKGIMLLGDTIHTEKWQGREFYLTDNCRTRGFRKGNYLLIPPYDEYLISYKSRDIVLSPEHRYRAHNNSGIFQPIIAKDGIICGNWSPFKDECQADFFLDEHTGNLQEEWENYQNYLLR